MKRLSPLTIAAALLLGGLGCSDEAPAAKPAAKAAAKKAEKAEAAEKPAPAAAAPAQAYVYAYSPVGKRDPFRAPEVRREDVLNEACTEPLCQYDLEQLSLVAVVTGDPNPIAMVEDPNGRGFVVRRNARLGRRGGKVSAIRRDELTVTEFWAGPDGKVVPNATVIKLQADARRAGEFNYATGQPY
jgi:type IV pilus assembly protein PilP